MASSNKNLKWKDADEVPLMDQNENQFDEKITFSKASLQSSSSISEDNDDDEGLQEKPFKQHDITLWLSDAVVLFFEHLQYYALLLSLSEHWGWPIDWVKATSFTFLFNFDIWEFRKVETGAFDHSRVSFISTSEIGFNYASYLAAWAIILCIIGGIFAGIYFRWMRKRPLYLLLYVARWKRVMFLVLQFLAVPFGVAAARVFHCRLDEATNKDVMAVQNEFDCFSGIHIAFITLVLIIFICLFIVYPFILYRWVRDQVFSNDPARHEGYLHLKEAEYEQGLDILWDIGQYHLFSSYKRFWIQYNPLKFIFKFFIIIAFALSLKSTFYSSAGITVIFTLATLVLIFKRPYRVRCFNVMIICSHFIIAANALIGNFMVRPPWEDEDTFQIVSFLRQPTISQILGAINVSWLIIFLFWIVYLVLLNNGLLGKERIWPRLSYESSNLIGEDTKKYLKAALKARLTLEHALAAIPLFAPVHELSHQVKVINAYCREAEYIGDPTHDTLWDLLDELIEAHNSLAPVSVFGMSGKNSIRETSEEFIKLMPSFKKRLKQREYDFILMTPLKRRLLLKMYILSVFVNNKRKNISPEEEASSKLQQALLEFDGRSLSDFDALSTNTRSTLSAGNSRAMSRNDRPTSSLRPTSSEIESRPDSDMTGFLHDVENFASLYPVEQASRNTSERRRSSKTSQGSNKSDERRSSKGSLGSTNSNKSDDRPLSKQSKTSISSIKAVGDKQRRISAPPTTAATKSAPRGKKISAPPNMISSAKAPDTSSISRPSTVPLSSSQQNRSSSSGLSSSRPGTATLSPIPQEHNSPTFNITDMHQPPDLMSIQNSQTDTILPHTRQQSPLFQTQPFPQQRPGTAPLSPTVVDTSSLPIRQNRPGTAPLSPTRLNTSSSRQDQSPVTSRSGSVFSIQRSVSPDRPESRSGTPLQEMSSTLSLPGQIEEEEALETKRSTTEL